MANANDNWNWNNPSQFNTFHQNNFDGFGVGQEELHFDESQMNDTNMSNNYGNRTFYGNTEILQPNFDTTTQFDHQSQQQQPHHRRMNYEQGTNEFDEPPLLDELEIYPDRIIEKSLAVLNPFHTKELSKNPAYLFEDTDLGGPILFCITLAVALFLSGSKAHFGYIYGLSMMSVIFMYILITLMCNTNDSYISFVGVASILGYSILPIVWLSVIGIFLPLNTTLGILLAIGAVILATIGASNIFCLMTGDAQQRLLIAYPCTLVYATFVLLVLF